MFVICNNSVPTEIQFQDEIKLEIAHLSNGLISADDLVVCVRIRLFRLLIFLVTFLQFGSAHCGMGSQNPLLKVKIFSKNGNYADQQSTLRTMEEEWVLFLAL